MAQYKVTWEIDIFDADSHEDAAQKALDIQRDPDSIAVMFHVRRYQRGAKSKCVDLLPVNEDPTCSECGGEIGIGGIEDVCADCVQEDE